MAKLRLDVAMTERGLAESRQKAQAIIMAGQVFVNGQKVDKAGAPVAPDAAIKIHGKTLKYVSRGGLKLEKAMACWPIVLEHRICADIGASTGGFTDCMLQNGADKVYSVDVGYNQLDYRLRIPPQGGVYGAHQRPLPHPGAGPGGAGLFFSRCVLHLTGAGILPAVRPLMKEGGQGVCLVKPQFEAGRDKVGKKGVDPGPGGAP